MGNLTSILSPGWSAESVANIIPFENQRIDYNEIDSALSKDIEENLRQWFPDKKVKRSGEWFKVGTHGSLAVSAVDGHWSSHETGDKGQGLLSLYAWNSGRQIEDAAHDFSSYVEPVSRAGEPEIPVHPQKGKASHVYKYRDENGRLRGVVMRWDFDGTKDIRQASLKDGEWHWGAIDSPRPLFGAENLRLMPDLPILLVEGEKCVEALQAIVQDHIVLTWAGGSSAVNQSHWKPLEGRVVTVWPDNDKPGFKAASDIQAYLPQANVLELPGDKAKGWDAADAVDDGFDVCEFIAKAKPSPFEDISDLWFGNIEFAQPTIGKFGKGKALLYEATTNYIFGTRSVGKSWICLALAKEAMENGMDVVFIDPESSAKRILWRLKYIGVAPDVGAKHFKYLATIDHMKVREAHAFVASSRRALVIYDGLANAIASAGKEENSNAALMILQQQIKPFADAGASVLVVDHTGKDESKGARGHSSKEAFFKGAVYHVKTIKAFTKGESGSLKLEMSKDNEGGVGVVQGKTVAVFEAEATEEGKTKFFFSEPDGSEDGILSGRKPKMTDKEIWSDLPVAQDDSGGFTFEAISPKLNKRTFKERCLKISGCKVGSKQNSSGQWETVFYRTNGHFEG